MTKMYKESVKEIPVYNKCDVVIVGGGCASLATSTASVVLRQNLKIKEY